MNFRNASISDAAKIKKLYLSVAKNEGGIARLEDEVTDGYISGFLNKSLKDGIILVALNENEIVGEIHAYKAGIRVFEHVLTDLTIAVSPDHQGKGIGKKLFLSFLETVKTEHHNIARVELIARESNRKAIQFYESIGFKIEGRFEKRIKTTLNTFEADIPMGWLNPNYQLS